MVVTRTLLTKATRGFSLIELLITISVMALLTTVVVAGMSGARTRGRDADRIADIKNLQVSLELYYDKHHYYPNSLAEGNVATVLNVLRTEGFISTIPDDPLPSQDYYYKSNASSNSSVYCLGANLEGTGYTGTSCSTVTLSSGYDYSVGPQGP